VAVVVPGAVVASCTMSSSASRTLCWSTPERTASLSAANAAVTEEGDAPLSRLLLPFRCSAGALLKAMLRCSRCCCSAARSCCGVAALGRADEEPAAVRPVAAGRLASGQAREEDEPNNAAPAPSLAAAVPAVGKGCEGAGKEKGAALDAGGANLRLEGAAGDVSADAAGCLGGCGDEMPEPGVQEDKDGSEAAVVSVTSAAVAGGTEAARGAS
jgi:hypothetical protein